MKKKYKKRYAIKKKHKERIREREKQKERMKKLIHINSILSCDLGGSKFERARVIFSFDENDIEERRREKKEEKIKRRITGPISYEEMKRDANNYERYLRIITTYCILSNVSPERYKEAVLNIKEMIKYLRKGRADKVYDLEKYEEYKEYMKR